MIQKQKGTYDVYGNTGKKIVYLENLLKALMEKYNYEYVRTPLFEASDLFHRGVGETSDIVSKETYDFTDRGNRNITLRPIKTWYYGPMYRYERPQSGRYREFYQFGVEVFGTNDPMIDAEIISIPVNFYKLLGLKGIKVNINSLGDAESRKNYRDALIEYFKPHINTLCEDCKTRFLKNPLRILDCKVDKETEILKNAPSILDYLNEESKKHFENVKKYLEALDIEYVVNPKIVRGLDYYTNTVFEVEANVEGFGSQNVLCAGGRYNNLVETIGGPSTAGIGFALGFERLLTALDYENINVIEDDGIDVYIIPMSENEKQKSLKLTNNLRMNGFKVDMDYLNRNIKSNFKQADRLNSKFVIIIGEEEIKTNVATIKNNYEKTEEKIEFDKLVEYLDRNI